MVVDTWLTGSHSLPDPSPRTKSSDLDYQMELACNDLPAWHWAFLVIYASNCTNASAEEVIRSILLHGVVPSS